MLDKPGDRISSEDIQKSPVARTVQFISCGFQTAQRLLSGIDGAGKVSVMIAQGSDGEIGGVVVVSSGADDIRVKLELQRVVRTLTGLELEKIEIVKSRD